MIDGSLAKAILGAKILINLNNLVAWPARTGIQRVCYEFCSRWPYLEDTIPFVELGFDRIGLLEPNFFKYLSQYFEQEDEVLADLAGNHGFDLSEVSPGWLGIVSAKNCIICEVSVEDALKYCRCVMSLEESLNMEFFSLAARTRPEKIFNLCHDFLSWTHPECFAIDWRNADNVSVSIANRRKYANNFFTSTAMREQYVNRINRGDTRSYAVIPPGADGFGRAFRKTVPQTTEFVVVGTLEPRKQPLRILDAFVELQARGIDTRLCFAGRMGWLKPEDKERLTQAFETYPWLRWVDGPGDTQLRELIASCRATIYLSVAEGFGSPPVESLALGVPCIVSAEIPSVIDMAPNGQIRIQPQDDFALVEAVKRLLDDREVITLQEEIETLVLPTWQEFVDGIVALVDEKAPPTASSDGTSLSYPATLAIIQVLMRLWELDRTTLIRDLFSAALPDASEQSIDLWDSEAREGNWSNLETVLQIMKALPRGVISPSLVNEAIAGKISVSTIPEGFSRDWIAIIDSLLTIDSEEEFEEAIYKVIHKRIPGPGECSRADSLRSGQCTRLDVLLEAIQSEEYRNRLIQLVKDERICDSLNPDEGQITLTSVSWQVRLLQDYGPRIAAERNLRLPAGQQFLLSAFHDLTGAYLPKDMDRFMGRVYEGESGKEMVLLDILLSEPCVRRVGNPAMHLDLIHWVAARAGIKAKLPSDPLSLLIKVNKIMSLSRHELVAKVPKILPVGHRGESERFVEDMVKRYVGRDRKAQETATDLASGLLLFGFLNGIIEVDNPILTWSVAQLVRHRCPASFEEKKKEFFAKSTLDASFAALLRRDPTTSEREILDNWVHSFDSRWLLLNAIRLFAFREGKIEDRYFFLLDFAHEFQLIKQHWPTLMKMVENLVSAKPAEPPKVLPPVHFEGGGLRGFDARLQASALPISVTKLSTDKADLITSVYQLLAFDGEAFVRKAYEVFLHREADSFGLNHYVDCLGNGEGKQSIIYDIVSSEEGKKNGVDLLGLDALIKKQSRKRSWIWKSISSLIGRP